MLIIGCDFHAGFQVLSIFDNRSAAVMEKRLSHPQEAMVFYRGLQEPARVGIEAGAPCQWFRRLMSECGHELWVGDAAKIRAAETRKQKTDRRDAELMMRLMVEERFPRIWVPSEARARCAAVADGSASPHAGSDGGQEPVAVAGDEPGGAEGQAAVDGGRAAVALRDLEMMPYAARRRDQLLGWVGVLDQQIAALDVLIAAEVNQRADARRLMTHPGIGPQTALAMVLTLGEVSRFANARKVPSYLGLVPSEYSSGGKQRLGHISKQGSALMRFLLVEAGQTAVRRDEELKRVYQRMCGQKGQSRGGQGDGGPPPGGEVVLDAPQPVDVCGVGSSCG